MNPLCETCGFRISTDCDCGITLTEKGWEVAKSLPDMVNHPPHYTMGAVECIDAIHAALGDDGMVAYCRGNAIKYLWRTGHKGNAVQDLEKAVWYIQKAVEVTCEAR